MNNKRRILVVTLAIVFVVSLLIPAYSSGLVSFTLPYEVLVKDVVASPYYQFSAAYIKVVTDIATASEVYDWIIPTDRDILSQVDYQKYFVIVAFNGRRGSEGNWRKFGVQRVLRRKGEVYIRAHFEDGGWGNQLPRVTSPYNILKIEKSAVGSGEIPFNLYDDRGDVRATTSAVINQ